MSFIISYSEEYAPQNNSIIPEGKYEATIINAESKEWNGNHYMNFGVEIRSDVEGQKYGGYKINFNDIQVSPTQPEYEEKRLKKVASFMKACGQIAGKNITLDELAKDIIGKNVLVYVVHKVNNKGETWPRISFVAPSQVKGLSSNSTQNKANNKGTIDISDDVLPF